MTREGEEGRRVKVENDEGEMERNEMGVLGGERRAAGGEGWRWGVKSIRGGRGGRGGGGGRQDTSVKPHYHHHHHHIKIPATIAIITATTITSTTATITNSSAPPLLPSHGPSPPPPTPHIQIHPLQHALLPPPVRTPPL